MASKREQTGTAKVTSAPSIPSDRLLSLVTAHARLNADAPTAALLTEFLGILRA